MAIRIATNDPRALLDAIKTAIDDGEIQTWSYDDDDDFTHSARQWQHLAWLRPELLKDELRFSILAPQNGTLTVEVYAIYHGRFIEMLLAHFDGMFSIAIGTAKPGFGDSIGD